MWQRGWACLVFVAYLTVSEGVLVVDTVVRWYVCSFAQTRTHKGDAVCGYGIGNVDLQSTWKHVTLKVWRSLPSFCDEQCPVDFHNDTFLSIHVLPVCSAQLYDVVSLCVTDIFASLPSFLCNRLFYSFMKGLQEVAKISGGLISGI